MVPISYIYGLNETLLLSLGRLQLPCIFSLFRTVQLHRARDENLLGTLIVLAPLPLLG